MNPALDSLRDDMREFLEFNSTAIARLGRSLEETEKLILAGRSGSAIACLRHAKTTQAVLAEQFATATNRIDQEAR